MTPSLYDALHKELMGDEGEVLKVYDDATGKPIGPGSVVIGNPTICIGRNLASRGMTKAESDSLFKNDVADLEADLTTALPWLARLSDNRQCAVYSLYFNVALGHIQKFLLGWPHFLEQMRTEQWEIAAANLETAKPWSTQVGPRAGRLANLVRYG